MALTGFHVEVLRPEHVEGATRAVVDAFAGREAMTAHIGITREEWLPYARRYCERAAAQGMSHVAVAGDSGKVACVCVSEDAVEPHMDVGDLSPKWRVVVEYLDQLTAKWPALDGLKAGRMLRMFIIATDPAFERRGLAGRLMEANLAAGWQRGYRGAILEATNRHSQRLALRAGFGVDVELSYADFSMPDGSRPYADYDMSHPTVQGMSMRRTDHGAALTDRPAAHADRGACAR